MKFSHIPLAIGALVLTGVTAQAQTRPATKTSTYTTVDPYGNVTSTTVQAPRFPPADPVAIIAQQGVYGQTGSTTFSYGTTRPNYGPAANYNYCPPTNYYPPAAYPYPANPYPYGGVVNNYYNYPAQPSTGVLVPPSYSWEKPSTFTNIPIGNQYSYGTPAYPGYGVPAYPGYTYPGYTYPASPYAYGGTYINGAGNGSITTQSQSSGIGVAVGRGGMTGRFGNNTSSSTTTIRTY